MPTWTIPGFIMIAGGLSLLFFPSDVSNQIGVWLCVIGMGSIALVTVRDTKRQIREAKLQYKTARGIVEASSTEFRRGYATTHLIILNGESLILRYRRDLFVQLQEVRARDRVKVSYFFHPIDRCFTPLEVDIIAPVRGNVLQTSEQTTVWEISLREIGLLALIIGTAVFLSQILSGMGILMLIVGVLFVAAILYIRAAIVFIRRIPLYKRGGSIPYDSTNTVTGLIGDTILAIGSSVVCISIALFLSQFLELS